MSRIDEGTLGPGETQVPGNPAAPEPVAPPDYDGHAEGEVSEGEREEGRSAAVERQPSPTASDGPTPGGTRRDASSSPSPDDGPLELEEAPVGGLEETRAGDVMETTAEEAGLGKNAPPQSRRAPGHDEVSSNHDRHGLESANDLTTP